MNRINAPDGTPLIFDAYEPAQSRLAILFLHDWYPPGLSDRWAPIGSQLRNAGFAAYFLDQRGQGRSGGPRGHLSRFSQLLGDLQAFRRAVRQRRDVPQLLVGHGFGGLVVLRYLETQPGEPPVAAIVAGPWLASRVEAPIWKRLAARLADLWPTLPTGTGAEFMTAGARAELQWAQRAVLADAQRIEPPLLFLLGGADRVIDVAAARRLVESLSGRARLSWYPELPHDLFAVPSVMDDVIGFAALSRSLGSAPKNE